MTEEEKLDELNRRIIAGNRKATETLVLLAALVFAFGAIAVWLLYWVPA